MNMQDGQHAASNPYERAEKLISLPTEDYRRLQESEVKGVVRDLVREVQELQTTVERLNREQSELSRSRQEAAELLEFAPAGYLRLDSRGVVSNVNITVCDMLGISKSEMIGVPFADRVEPQYWDALRSHLKDIADTGQRLSAEFEMRRRDGTTFFARLQTVPLYEHSEITYRLWVTDITERKRTEIALRESEKRYRDLAELLPEIVFETDAQGRLTFANARALAVFGLTADNLANGFSVFEVVLPEQRDIAVERFRKILQGTPIGPHEYVLLGKNGSSFPAIVHSSRIEAGGEVQGIRGVSADITERKKAEGAVRESETRLRTTLDNMLEGCVIVDFNWRYLYANDAAARLTGIPKEARVGKSVMEVMTGIETQEVWAHMKRCLEDRIPGHYETEITLPDGRKLWFEQRAEPVPQGMLLLYTDITERRKVKQALQESEHLLRSTLDSALEACVIVDFNWRYLYANAAADRLGRRPKEEQIGRTIMEVLPGIEKLETFSFLKRCLEDRIEQHYETEFTYPEGDKIWLEVRTTPVPMGMLIFWVDISQRKAAEQRLKDDVERLQRIYTFTQVPGAKPVGLLMIEHKLIERVIALAVLKKAMIAQTNAPDRDFIYYVVDFFRTYADRTHQGKEEDVLFKALAAKPLTPEHGKTMDRLMQEHALERKLVSDLHKAQEGWAAGDKDARERLMAALEALVELYPRHMETEDKLFFLPTAEYFSPQELNDMLLEMSEYDREIVHRRYTDGLETLTRMLG